MPEDPNSSSSLNSNPNQQSEIQSNASGTTVDPIAPPPPPQTPAGIGQIPPGSGTTVNIPPGVDGWGWGPFFLTWLWGIFHGVWISLLVFLPIPFLGLVIAIVLGINGRKWAWQNKKWESVEHFNQVQRKWSIAGIILFGLSLTLIPLILILSMIVVVAINPLERVKKAEYTAVNSDVIKVGGAVSKCIENQISLGTSPDIIYSIESFDPLSGKGGCASSTNLINSQYINTVPSGVTITTGDSKICVYKATLTTPPEYASYDSDKGNVTLAPSGTPNCN